LILETGIVPIYSAGFENLALISKNELTWLNDDGPVTGIVFYVCRFFVQDG